MGPSPSSHARGESPHDPGPRRLLHPHHAWRIGGRRAAPLGGSRHGRRHPAGGRPGDHELLRRERAGPQPARGDRAGSGRGAPGAGPWRRPLRAAGLHPRTACRGPPPGGTVPHRVPVRGPGVPGRHRAARRAGPPLSLRRHRRPPGLRGVLLHRPPSTPRPSSPAICWIGASIVRMSASGLLAVLHHHGPAALHHGACQSQRHPDRQPYA